MVAAILPELSGLTGQATLGGVVTSDVFEFDRCLRQGGKESPSMVVEYDDARHASAAAWRLACGRVGVQLGNAWRSHLVWADNLFFVARDASGLQGMMNEVTQVLAELDLKWKASSLE